jgi:hypothetical protein
MMPDDNPSRWVVREAPFATGRFYAMKVRPHRRLPNTVEVIGNNQHDVTEDVEHYIRQYGGTPPREARDSDAD